MDFYDGMYEAGCDDLEEYMDALEKEQEEDEYYERGPSKSQGTIYIHEEPKPQTLYMDYLLSVFFKRIGVSKLSYTLKRITGIDGQECLAVNVAGISDDGEWQYDHDFWPYFVATKEDVASFPQCFDDLIVRISSYSESFKDNRGEKPGGVAEWIFGIKGKTRYSLNGGERHAHNIPMTDDYPITVQDILTKHPEKITEEDADKTWVDQYGAVYSSDRLRLLSFPLDNQILHSKYYVLAGTVCICEDAFSPYKKAFFGTSNTVVKMYTNDSNLHEVILPNTIRVIGKNAFMHCDSLNSINIPAGVTQIEDSTFEDCRHLENVIIEGALTYIGDKAFSVTGIKSFPLTPALTRIGKKAFAPSHIREITIPGSVEVLEEDTFLFCHELKSITLCEGVKNIKKNGISHCWQLETINLPSSLIDIDEWGLSSNATLKRLDLPDSLERLGDSALYESQLLEELRIPASLKYIGSNALHGCMSLKKIFIPKGYMSGEGDLNKAQIALAWFSLANPRVQFIEY
ncbi:MAG: leucine-rich repeat domain-containing protein [Bacteroidales bacterium]|nr:leucine-rich repeat domain-containing protein [Bacteroidales bacterium]